jgi:hypothetical protein
MKTFVLYCALAAITLSSFACSSYVQSVEPLQNIVFDTELNDQSQVPFMVNGVLRQFAAAYSQVTTISGGLSDELVYDNRVPNATFPQFNELELTIVNLDNTSVANSYAEIGRYRFVADRLALRAAQITYTDNAAGQAARATALLTGNIHSGIARYLVGNFFGISQQRVGGTIDVSPFIPAVAMADSSVAYFNRSLQAATTDLQRRQINSMIAKAHLAVGRYPEARMAALNGLRRGDASFDAQYSAATVFNQWYFDAGRGRCQLHAARRFADYITADTLEGQIFRGTISTGGVTSVTGFANTNEDADMAAAAARRRLAVVGPITGSGGFTFFLPLRYPNQNSAVPFVTWQENELILAETALRVANDAAAALTNVNNVRTGYGLANRSVTNLDSVYIERDKTLFGSGTRLIDQRRFNRWHLTIGDSWQTLPIPLTERNTNPNLRNN